MTKSKILLSLFLILIVCSSCCFATIEPRTADESTTSQNEIMPISETENQGETQATSETDSWTNSDLYLANEKVTVSNVVDGNAFIIGNEVTISGEIGGDLFVLANKLNIDGGYIYSSIFALANEITINGVVYDLYAACNELNIESNGFVYRDMRVTASNVNLNGRIRRDAYIVADKISFNEEIGTIVYGNLDYSSGSQISIPEGVVQGTTTYSTIDKTNNEVPSIGSIILSKVLELVKTLLLTFVITLISIWLAPKFVEKVENMSVSKSFASLGVGFATPIALILVSIILMISVVGIPLLVVMAIIFALLAYIATSITCIYFGKLFAKLFKLEGNVKFILLTLASSLVIWLISLIPVLGGLVSFLAIIFGIGVALVNIVYKKEKTETKKDEKKEEKKDTKKEVIEEPKKEATTKTKAKTKTQTKTKTKKEDKK